MASGAGDDQLVRNRVVTIILRLLVGPEGHLVQGEVVDLEGTSHGRFRLWTDLTQLVERWLAALPIDPGGH